MFWRVAIAAALLCTCCTATAQQQCPGSNASWSFAMPPPYQWAVYDQLGQYSIPLGYLSILYLDRTAETFIGVSQQVAQKFQSSPHPDKFFEQQIKRSYHELLINPGSNCPLLNPGSGALWTR